MFVTVACSALSAHVTCTQVHEWNSVPSWLTVKWRGKHIKVTVAISRVLDDNMNVNESSGGKCCSHPYVA